jgi:hypothetical protein
LCSDSLAFDDQRVRSIAAGHTDWSSRLAAGLSQLQTRYVLLLLEDFFLRQPVRTATVARALNCMAPLDAVMVRLIPRPGPTSLITGMSDVGLVQPGAPYRVSTQAAIWDRATLLELLRPGESIWEFEIAGSIRSCATRGNFLCCWESAMPYGHHVVERGRWFRHERRRYRSANIGCDFGRREVKTVSEQMYWRLGHLRSVLLSLLSSRQRQWLVRNLL